MGKDKFWEYFDDDAKEYVSTIMAAEGDLYEKSAAMINQDLTPPQQGIALDIGNGGIINYDADRLARLDCADIYLNPRIVQVYKDVPNIRFIEADITDMHDIASESYDIVIVQNVIHHLAEKSYRATVNNCVKAMKECLRVLKPGGRLILCESTVRRWFETLEKTFYPLMMKCCDWIHFDRVYQYSRQSLRRILQRDLAADARILREEDIGQGEYVLFLGRKVRSCLLPLTVSYFVVEKNKPCAKR